MPRVFCSIPDTQPGPINGQEFVRHEDGVLVSVGEVSDDNLAIFSSVPGFSVETEAEAAEALQKAADKLMADAQAAAQRAKDAAAAAAAAPAAAPRPPKANAGANAAKGGAQGAPQS